MASEAPSIMAIGKRLSDAREKLGLSVEDVSSSLRLSVRQISALETEEFNLLPEPAITRGFIRNYARLLEIPAEPLLDIYRELSPSETPKAITIQSANILISGGDKRPWLAYIVASVLVILLLAAWMAYFDFLQYSSPEPVTESPVKTEPQANAEQQSNATVTTNEPMPEIALPAAEREPEVMTPVQAAVVPASPESAASKAPSIAPTAPVAARNLAKIKFSFVEQTWVSVLDKDKKEIFNKNKPANTSDEIEGQPPFMVTIGNATGAKLFFNDKPVDLAPYTKLNVARVTLE